VGRGYGRLELRDHPAPSLAVCACFTAMMTESLGLFRARHAEVNKTACEGVGDAACIYTATWM
jgi:predicted hydrocarbon binding protein